MRVTPADAIGGMAASHPKLTVELGRVVQPARDCRLAGTRRAGAGCKRDAKDRAQLPVGNRARSCAAGPKKILGGPPWCQMPQIIDSRNKVLLQLTGRTVRHFHPNRQPKLIRLATRRASAMRDGADIRGLCRRQPIPSIVAASFARSAA